ncbi:hypothetical protein ACTMTJ_27055 [Phytohabitans sp. LJ34]|uniref:hypothetical protein n=1 Tax=Phytohabitans sp. LJ34 TaxID=3452217 RepID=UPI003F890175
MIEEDRWAVGAGGVTGVRGDHWLDSPAGDAIARGLARNPAAPLDLLLRLLDAHPDAVPAAFRRRADLPPAVVEAAARHPSARVRGAIASNVHVDPAVRLRLLDDPERRVSELVRDDRVLVLPHRAFHRWVDRLVSFLRRNMITLAELRDEVFEMGAKDARAVPALAAHPEPLVRAAAVELLDRSDGESARLRQALSRDPAPEVRAAVARLDAERERVHEVADIPRNGHFFRAMVYRRRLSPALVAHVLATDPGDLMGGVSAMADNPHLPPETVEELFAHPAADVRAGLARRTDLTRSQLARLAADPDVSVRTAVSTHPALSEDERARIDIDVTTASEGEPDPLAWPLAESVRLAASVNPLLRRRAAVDPRLPAEVVAALADDPDLGVRALLAQHHPAAPPELLLRVFREYREPGRFRLPLLPGFPTGGLAALAGDDDPAVRRLAARDPLADPALVDRLTGDPDAGVRRAMAACPRLPADRILALLDDAELAEYAAANPALPVDVMYARLTS